MTEHFDWDALGIVAPDPGPYPIEPEGDDVRKQPAAPTQATELMRMARARFSVVRGDDGKSYAVAHDQPGIAFGMRGSGGLRLQLAAAYFDEKDKVASGGALADALAALEGDAMRGRETRVHLRCGRHHGAIIIDRADHLGHAIEVTATGWRSLERSPILFRRSNMSLEFPLPEVPGDLDQLRALLNTDEAGFRLIVGFIVAAWIPDIPHPILALLGEQGSAKSDAARLVLGLIDPSASSLISQPRSGDDWAVSAYNLYGVGLDNVSHMQPWFQDALCKAVTGDTFVRRELYTDDGLIAMRFQRPIVLTSIDPGNLQGDVADRLLKIELPRIASTNRRTDRQQSTAIEKARPAIVAGLLDTLAGVLAELPKVNLDVKPRMADFAEVLAALDAHTGWSTLDDYMRASESAAHDVVDGDTFASAIVALVEKLGQWSGTCQELLEQVKGDEVPKGWPHTARAVASRLTRLSPALRASGVEVDRREERSNRGAIYDLTRTSGPRCVGCGKPLPAAAATTGATLHTGCQAPLIYDEEPF